MLKRRPAASGDAITCDASKPVKNAALLSSYKICYWPGRTLNYYFWKLPLSDGNVLSMNAYLLQLMNKIKYPFSRCKNIARRRREQAKANLTQKERFDEIKLIIVMLVVVVGFFAVSYFFYASLLF